MKDAKTAMLVMVLAILFSVLFGTHRTLGVEANKVENTLIEGVDGDGIGIGNDLSIRMDASYNLVTIAKHYLDETDSSIQAVLDARNALADADISTEKSAANLNLTEAYTDLSEKLKGEAISETDDKYRIKLITDLDSRNDTIRHDGYNDLAAEYNAKLKVFPANLIGPLVGVKPLGLFR